MVKPVSCCSSNCLGDSLSSASGFHSPGEPCQTLIGWISHLWVFWFSCAKAVLIFSWNQFSITVITHSSQCQKLLMFFFTFSCKNCRSCEETGSHEDYHRRWSLWVPTTCVEECPKFSLTAPLSFTHPFIEKKDSFFTSDTRNITNVVCLNSTLFQCSTQS